MRVLGCAIFGSQNLLLHACHTQELVQLVLSASPEPAVINGEDDEKEIWHHFNPMVASYWLMNLHFHNPYLYLKCEDGTLIHFLQNSGSLFVGIGRADDTGVDLEQYLSVYAAFSQNLAGPGFQLLQNPRTSDTLTRLMEMWRCLQETEVFAAAQGIERIPLSSDLAGFSISTLQNVLLDFHRGTGTSLSYLQGFFLIDHRLMSIFSGSGAPEISSAGMLFLIAFVATLTKEQNAPSELLHSNLESGSHNLLLFLQTTEPSWFPAKVFVEEIRPKVQLVIVEQVASTKLVSSAFNITVALNRLEFADPSDAKRTSYKITLKEACRRLLQQAKKTSPDSAEKPCKLEMDLVPVSRYLERFSTGDTPQKEQRLISRLRLAVDDFFSELNTFVVLADDWQDLLGQIKDRVFQQLNPSGEFTQLCSLPLERSIGKVDLGKFPELVHFIYVDRSSSAGNEILMPCYTQQDEFHQEQILSMISVAMSSMREGKTWSTWTDAMFRYSHAILMESSPGQFTPLESILTTEEWCGMPGILGQDSYQQLIQRYKHSTNKLKKDVNCHELFCLHLALSRPETVLEQVQRLPKIVNQWLRRKPAFDFEFLL